MDITKYDLAFLLVVLTAILVGAWISSEKKESLHTYELVRVINGDEYVVDYGLSESDCIKKLQPHPRNYCARRLFQASH